MRSVALVGAAAVVAIGVTLAATPVRGIFLGQDEEESIASSPPAASPTLLPDPSIPPDPFITATGILTRIVGEKEDGGFFDHVCVADAEVVVEAGRVERIIGKGTEVRIDLGEPVKGTETLPLGPTISVYRGADGILIFGTRSCEEVTRSSPTPAGLAPQSAPPLTP